MGGAIFYSTRNAELHHHLQISMRWLSLCNPEAAFFTKPEYLLRTVCDLVPRVRDNARQNHVLALLHSARPWFHVKAV